ncbi:hypothetical protein [Desulfosporosinus youngiae]|uniref:Uncharacterized protein n=1 Tax=Desulfosporosinus youngiae DSM 17734 TaxID=768710 RepID=H5XTD1_9FIRM|nr:hypothetical protein [Desulfosporosinus youngiae]EHQ88390.1 hypothetical protein DesyoDRAFT_1222 [Desulfosporosinus youngiae DSM 17734]
MTVSGLEKQKEQAINSKDLLKKEQAKGLKPDCTDDLRIKIKKALEAENLCYDCETGFHYMKQ